MNRPYLLDPQCGHIADDTGVCSIRCRNKKPNTPTNPDKSATCRYCGGIMQPRSIIDGGMWATCDRCGTSRYVRLEAT